MTELPTLNDLEFARRRRSGAGRLLVVNRFSVYVQINSPQPRVLA